MYNFTATTVAPTRHRFASISSEIKATALATMLVAIAAISPASAFASDINNINRAAAMEKQRNLNKANLAKIRHFDRRPKSTGSMKLDALPPSPRRGADSDSLGSLRTGSAKTRRGHSVLPSIDN